MATETTAAEVRDDAEYGSAADWPAWCDDDRWVPTDPDAPGEWGFR
jgi:hypothetical protein